MVVPQARFVLSSATLCNVGSTSAAGRARATACARTVSHDTTPSSSRFPTAARSRRHHLRASAVPSSSTAAPEIVCPLPEWREVARNDRGLFAGDPPRPIYPNWMGVRNAVEEASIRFPSGQIRYAFITPDSKTFARDAFWLLHERPHRMILPHRTMANTAPFSVY